MLPDKYAVVLRAQNHETFLQEIINFTKELGFDTVNATVVVNQVGMEPRFVWIDNTTPAYKHIADDFKRGRIDPVSQHCKRTSVPIVWDQETYIAANLAHLWEEQAPFGHSTGIALALHLPNGLHFVMEVDRKQPLPKRRSEISRMAGELHLLVAHAQDAAMRLLLPPCAAGDERSEADSARAGKPALDDGRQDRLGGWPHPRHQRADGCPARRQRHPQAGLREQASRGGQGAASGTHSMNRIEGALRV